MNLALFDFDGTITTEDTFTKFLFYSTPKSRLIIGLCLTSPIIAMYKLGLLPASKTRPVLSKVAFWLRSPSDVQKSAKKYVDEYIPTTLREEMIEKIRWHSEQGDEIYLVSASLDPYLSIWCKQKGMALVCSTLEVRNGRYTGNYVNGDCSKQRKVTGIQQATDLSSYSKIYAYGDTVEDLPMLGLADIKYYQGKPVNELADLN